MRALLKAWVPKLIVKAVRKTLRFPYVLYRSVRTYIHHATNNPSVILRENSTDGRVYYSIFIQGEFDHLLLTQEPTTIIDAGAYIGLSALFFNKAFPNASIIAIEPEQSNFELLSKNTGHLNNVTRVKGGLWSKDACLRISDRGTGSWGFTVTEVPCDEPHDVEGISIGTLITQHKLERIDILKLDIEGAEKELFSENTSSWLPLVNTMIIELHDRINPGCSDSVYSAIDLNEWNESKRGEKIILTRKQMV